MTIFGWDSSHFDAVPDTERAIAEGFLFFSHKAGGDANDAELAAWWAGAKKYRDRALLGAYWVLYPGSPISRADAFVKRLDDQCPGWRDGPFILQVDCEKWNNDSGTVPNKNDIRTFCDRLAAKMPKLRPIVYAPAWVYGNTLNGLGYPLWASSYVGGSGTASALYPGDSSGKWAPYSGQTPAILQFSSSATIAGQTTCDANAYRGTLAELTNLVAPGWEIDMPLTDDDVNKVETGVWSHDSITNPKQRADSPLHDPAGANQAVQAGYALGDAWARIYDLRDAVKALDAKVSALSTASVDVDALATALEPKINGMTKDQVKAALVEVFEEGTGGTV
jgi:hypothetical protein